jgi:FG-GAP-like repeat
MATSRLADRVPPAAALSALVLLGACGGPSTSSSAAGSSAASQSSASSGMPSATPSLEAAPAFKRASVTAVPEGDAWSIAVGDLNSDDKPDLVTATAYPQGVVILFGHGDGTFEPGPNLRAGSSKVVKAADLDGDGSLDLVAAGDELAVLLGHGDGTFEPPVNYGAGQDRGTPDLNVLGLAIDDLNADAVPDLAAANWVGSQLAVLIGRGDGTFDAASAYACPHCDAVAIADLDADGDRDVVATGFTPGASGTMSVFLNGGNGAMSAGADANPQGNTVAVAVADLNGDGNQDVVTGNDGNQSISVLLGKGDGDFADAQTYRAGNIHTVVVVDLDDDGQLDILAGQGVAAKLWFYRGTGNGGLVETQGIDLTPEVAPFFAVADLNADQRLDLAVYYATQGAGKSWVAVLLGE